MEDRERVAQLEDIPITTSRIWLGTVRSRLCAKDARIVELEGELDEMWRLVHEMESACVEAQDSCREAITIALEFQTFAHELLTEYRKFLRTLADAGSQQ